MAWDSLVVGDQVYLAVANHGSNGRYETHSRIYTMDSTAKLTVVQNISTQGASDVKFFRPPGLSDIYLIVANQIDNAGQTRISSQVTFLTCVRLLLAFALIVSAHPYCVRKFTWHVMHRACAQSTKMNNDRADGHFYSLA